MSKTEPPTKADYGAMDQLRRLEQLTRLRAQAATMSAKLTRYKNLFDLANDAVYVHMMGKGGDLGRFIEVNRAATEMLGYTQEEFLAMSPGDIDALPCETDVAHLRQLMTEHGRAVFRMGHKAKDGRIVPVEVSAHLFNMDGRPTVLSIVRDVSERLELHNRLVEAKKQAEAASQAKSEFLANLSHEIRTPLNGVLGLLQLMELTGLDGEQQDYAAQAQKVGRGLLALLTDILDLAKLESGRLDVATEPFDPLELIRETVGMLEHQALDKGLAIRLAASDLPKSMPGDRARLRQAVFNLVANAIKFTDKGTVTVKAKAAPMPDSTHSTIEIQVSDTGPGIPEHLIQTLLEEPFTQADGSKTRKHGGTGLGLPVAKRLAQRMNGDLTLENRPQGGLTATLRMKVRLA